LLTDLQAKFSAEDKKHAQHLAHLVGEAERLQTSERTARADLRNNQQKLRAVQYELGRANAVIDSLRGTLDHILAFNKLASRSFVSRVSFDGETDLVGRCRVRNVVELTYHPRSLIPNSLQAFRYGLFSREIGVDVFMR
jgi:hypothetical protein